MQSVRCISTAMACFGRLRSAASAAKFNKQVMDEVAAGPVNCKTCSHPMALEGAVLDGRDPVG